MYPVWLAYYSLFKEEKLEAQNSLTEQKTKLERSPNSLIRHGTVATLLTTTESLPVAKGVVEFIFTQQIVSVVWQALFHTLGIWPSRQTWNLDSSGENWQTHK